jgi:hypothetical protein
VTLETAEDALEMIAKQPFKTKDIEESLCKLITQISCKEANHVG